MKIVLAQTKPVTGDLEGNVQQILRDIRRAHAEGADMVVFPETAITGYCCGALFDRDDFVAYNKMFLEDVIAKQVPDNLVAVVGFVDVKGRKKDGFPNITNSVAVIQGGKIVDTYDKILLANGNHHEDKKYFTPGQEVKVIEVSVGGRKVKIGTPICEDIWYKDHERDIVAEMKSKGAEIVLVPNYSYFYYGKQDQRRELCSSQAREKGLPVVYVNAAGVGDIVKNIMIYDGGSFAYDSKGNLATELKRFESDFSVVEIDLKKPTDAPVTPKHYSKYDEIYDALGFEQKELFSLVGIPNAQVHLSGGIDSAVVAAVVSDAMGKDHTVLITNPTVHNSDTTKGYAQHVADSLGIKLYWNPTQEPYTAIVTAHTTSFGKEPNKVGEACIEAVTRTVQGIGAYHHFNSGIVACGNHTEIVEGWATFHDIGSIGLHALIGDLTKIEVFEFASYINKRLGREIIPHELYDGSFKPAAELADANEDPLDYYVRSGIDAEIIRERKSVFDLVDAFRSHSLTPEYFPVDTSGMTIYDKLTEQEFKTQVFEAYANSQRSVFKSAQGAPIVLISPRSRGFSNRETIINKYRGWYNVR